MLYLKMLCCFISDRNKPIFIEVNTSGQGLGTSIVSGSYLWNSDFCNKIEGNYLLMMSDVYSIVSNITLNVIQSSSWRKWGATTIKTLCNAWLTKYRILDCAKLVQPYFTFKEEILSIACLLFKCQSLIAPKSTEIHDFIGIIQVLHMVVLKTSSKARTSFGWRLSVSPSVNRHLFKMWNMSQYTLPSSWKKA